MKFILSTLEIIINITFDFFPVHWDGWQPFTSMSRGSGELVIIKENEL